MPIIKVDRVKTLDELKELHNCNVDIIGIDLGEDSTLFCDERTLSTNEALRIVKEIKGTKLAIWASLENPNLISVLEDVRPDYLQISVNELRMPSNLEKLKVLLPQTKIIYADIRVSFDDDPSWVLSMIPLWARQKDSIYQIDFFGDMEGSWDQVSGEPEYVEEFNLNDVKTLCNDYRVIGSMDYNENNLDEILKTVPELSGVAFILAENANIDDFHFFSFERTKELLKSII